MLNLKSIIMIWNKWINKFYCKKENIKNKSSECDVMLHFTKRSQFRDTDKKFSYSELLQGYKACEIIYKNSLPGKADATYWRTNSIKSRIIDHAFEKYKAETEPTKPSVIDKIVTTNLIYKAAEKLAGKKIADKLCDSDDKQIIKNPFEYMKYCDQQIINNYFEKQGITKPLDYKWTEWDFLKDLALKQNSSSDSWILKNEKFNPGIQSSDGDSTDNSLKFSEWQQDGLKIWAIIGDFEIKQNYFDE
jgi:hypothetical protein